MTVERAIVRVAAKPWGSDDLRPWRVSPPNSLIGELSFERPGAPSPEPALLLKLLFAQQPLSIQVHPDDAMAHDMGLPRGKAEAWYVLSALPDAVVARGLLREVTPEGLRSAIADGSIEGLVHWQAVRAHDVVAVPAGTIHALGGGLVVAELQQRSDTTFRLFDFGRTRPLQVDEAVIAARRGPAGPTPAPWALTPERTVLVAWPHFVFERITLAPGSRRAMDAAAETWVLVIAGAAAIGTIGAGIGEAVFLQDAQVGVVAGGDGATLLAGYLAATPAKGLLTDATLSSEAHA